MKTNQETNKENGKWIHPRAALITGIVLVAAALRILPHPMNFAPMGALALFGGAYFSTQASRDCRPPAVAHRGRHFYWLSQARSVRVCKFSLKRRHWLLAAAKKIRLSHWRGHISRRDSIFPDHQFRVVGVSIGSLSEKCGRPGRMLYRGPAVILEHAGGRCALRRAAFRRHGPSRKAVPVSAGTAHRRGRP